MGSGPANATLVSVAVRSAGGRMSCFQLSPFLRQAAPSRPTASASSPAAATSSRSAPFTSTLR